MTETRATERKQKTREKIRNAAQQLFLQHGFTATSTDAIMVRAGIASKETLYRYYASKEELFTDVLRHFTVEKLEHSELLQTSLAPQSLEELRTVFTTFAQVMMGIIMQPDYLAFIRMLIAELPRFPYLGEIFRSTVPEQAMQLLTTMLEQARQRGLVHAVDADAVIRMFIGSLLTYVLLDGLFQPEKTFSPPPSARIEAIIDALMKAIA